MYGQKQKFSGRYTVSKMSSLEKVYRPCKGVCIVHQSEKRGYHQLQNSNIMQVEIMWLPVVLCWLLFCVQQWKGCWDSKLRVGQIMSSVFYKHSIKILKRYILQFLRYMHFLLVTDLRYYSHLIFKWLFENITKGIVRVNRNGRELNKYTTLLSLLFFF